MSVDIKASAWVLSHNSTLPILAKCRSLQHTCKLQAVTAVSGSSFSVACPIGWQFAHRYSNIQMVVCVCESCVDLSVSLLLSEQCSPFVGYESCLNDQSHTVNLVYGDILLIMPSTLCRVASFGFQKTFSSFAAKLIEDKSEPFLLFVDQII